MSINHSALKSFIVDVFLCKQFSFEHAEIAANVLLEADLTGIDSHGIARLSGYLRLIDSGRINVNPNFTLDVRKKTTGRFDADGGIGLVSAQIAMGHTIEMCHEYGSGWLAIFNSSHYGVGAAHSSLALQHNYIGFSMTNATPLVTPALGKERMLGTNPICISIPGKNGQSFVLDMATSAAANGKLEIAQRQGKSIPDGWLINANGEISKNPNDLKEGGFLLPLGSNSDGGYHKGYALGSWVDIFSGVLSGANFGPWVPPFVQFLNPQSEQVGKGIGHFIGCWDMDGFSELNSSHNALEIWMNRFKSTIAIDPKNPVMIPGEIENLTKENRLINGIPLNNIVIQDIEKIAKSLQLKSPF
jgi:LDH2 family malate/lactate/ureidoglycolate dehydrogenase